MNCQYSHYYFIKQVFAELTKNYLNLLIIFDNHIFFDRPHHRAKRYTSLRFV